MNRAARATAFFALFTDLCANARRRISLRREIYFHRTKQGEAPQQNGLALFFSAADTALLLPDQSFLVQSSRYAIMAGFTRTVTALILSPPS